MNGICREKKEKERKRISSSNTAKKRRYRAIIRKDPVRYKEQKRKDRERKRKKRADEKTKSKGKSDKFKQNVIRYRPETEAKTKAPKIAFCQEREHLEIF